MLLKEPEKSLREILDLLGDQSIAAIYRDRVRTQRTRRYEIYPATPAGIRPARPAVIEILHTLLGIELRIGRRRLFCPDLSTARYLATFARLGVPEVAIPYDITRIAHLADDLESSWYRMLMLAEQAIVPWNDRAFSRLRRRLIETQREGVLLAGSGPLAPRSR